MKWSVISLTFSASLANAKWNFEDTATVSVRDWNTFSRLHERNTGNTLNVRSLNDDVAVLLPRTAGRGKAPPPPPPKKTGQKVKSPPQTPKAPSRSQGQQNQVRPANQGASSSGSSGSSAWPALGSAGPSGGRKSKGSKPTGPSSYAAAVAPGNKGGAAGKQSTLVPLGTIKKPAETPSQYRAAALRGETQAEPQSHQTGSPGASTTRGPARGMPRVGSNSQTQISRHNPSNTAAGPGLPRLGGGNPSSSASGNRPLSRSGSARSLSRQSSSDSFVSAVSSQASFKSASSMRSDHGSSIASQPLPAGIPSRPSTPPPGSPVNRPANPGVQQQRTQSPVPIGGSPVRPPNPEQPPLQAQPSSPRQLSHQSSLDSLPGLTSPPPSPQDPIVSPSHVTGGHGSIGDRRASGDWGSSTSLGRRY